MAIVGVLGNDNRIIYIASVLCTVFKRIKSSTLVNEQNNEKNLNGAEKL